MCNTQHLETVRRVFGASIYAWRVDPDGFSLIIRHRATFAGHLGGLQERWALLGGKTIPRGERLMERVTSLSGFMQTLLQTASRQLRKACGGPGTWWTPRYRSCLLSDDSALIAAVLAMEDSAKTDSLASSREQRGNIDGLPQLATLPSVDAGWRGASKDITPMGIKPPPPGQDHTAQRLPRTGAEDHTPIYAQASARPGLVAQKASVKAWRG